MSLITYTPKELDLLARLMRAEAIGEGALGMLMVGNVVVNRILANCLTFKDINTVTEAIFQSPGGFVGTTSPLFLNSATTYEKSLAEKVLNGQYFYPATHALWFYAPTEGTACVNFWYEQELVGRYKNHCFYRPIAGACEELY
ncbi:MAG: cell wall hydrolase [Tenericutes bacterium]|nr:cell wall hydrolase [Mycoplasmatota bacterium]